MEKMRRVDELLSFTRRMLAHQIKADAPDLSDNQVRIAVARRLYMSDPDAQKLLDMAEAHERIIRTAKSTREDPASS
jgi:hypothetical protein